MNWGADLTEIHMVKAARWGCNLYATEEDAARSGNRFLNTTSQGYPKRTQHEVYVWRTVDGFYDWSAISEPTARKVPWLREATLIRPTEGA